MLGSRVFLEFPKRNLFPRWLMSDASARDATHAHVTHRTVLAIAVPIMASNVSEPLIGVVDTAVVGQLPEPHYIGAVALGAAIFSVLFWTFGFLRMGTGGLTAQAFGRGDGVELRAVLGRALLLAGGLGVALILLTPVISWAGFALMGASEAVEEEARIYLVIRIWAAPFSLANYVFLGWFIGLGRAGTAFVLQLILNVTNMVLDAVFVLGLGMTADGVALGTLCAAVIAFVCGLWAAQRELSRHGGGWSWARIVDSDRLKRMVAVNTDIMIRSLCLLFALAFFTAQGARQGDLLLAANAVLLNFINVYAYLLDGFAFAAESLVGRSVGSRNRRAFRSTAIISTMWAFFISLGLAATTLLFGPSIIDLLTVNEDIRHTARMFLPWVALAPILGVGAFQLDGMFIGATQTRDMRNMMILSLAVYLAAWATLMPVFGNHGLWLALLVFYIVRGVALAVRLPALMRDHFDGPPVRT